MKKLTNKLIVTIVIVATIVGLSICKVEAKTTSSTSNKQTVSKKSTIAKKVKVTKVKINKVSTLYLGQKTTLKATITPSNASNKNVTWKSSNSKIIKVVDAKKGIIQAKKVGKATITATATDGSGKKASITINVKKCNHSEKCKEIKPYDANYNLVQYRCKQCNQIISTKKEKKFDASSYKGVWQWYNGMDIPETELIINKIEGEKVKFDIEMYRLASFENVAGVLSGNVITFNIKEDPDMNIKGKIVLNNNKVILNIEESSWDNIKKGETTFKKKSKYSSLRNYVYYNFAEYKGVWQYFESENKDIPETELIINKVDDEKINFDIEMYRISSFNNINADVIGNIVSFDATNEEGWNIKGKISLEHDVIILDIEQSSVDIIKTNSTWFWRKNKTQKSILKGYSNNALKSYKGVWQYFDGMDIPETELIINKIDSKNVDFDLHMYRIAGFENVTGVVSGNTATFSIIEDNELVIKGKIVFGNNKVTLNIEKSSWDYIKTGKTVFNKKSNNSILK